MCCICREYNFEVIIVDDASPDGTQDTVKKLQGIYGEDRIVRVLPIFDMTLEMRVDEVSFVRSFGWARGWTLFA